MGIRIPAHNVGKVLIEQQEHIVDAFLEESLKRIKDKTPVQSGTLRDSFYIDGDEYTIVSNVDYAGYVEFGTSYMVPASMIQKTAQEADIILKKVIRQNPPGKY